MFFMETKNCNRFYLIWLQKYVGLDGGFFFLLVQLVWLDVCVYNGRRPRVFFQFNRYDLSFIDCYVTVDGRSPTRKILIKKGGVRGRSCWDCPCGNFRLASRW